MAVRRLLGPLVVVVLLTLPSQTRASGSIESQVFSLINGSRSAPLVLHSGLAAAARGHSQQMAVSGGLHHDGADARVANASPDPVEANGAPDDGFATAAWCENVTYSTGFPESQVAQKLFQQWRRSASHNSCMTNSSKNVGAVGVYYDGSTWWATFIAEVDRTPPGGARSQPAGTPNRPSGSGAGSASQPQSAPARPADGPAAPAGAPPPGDGIAAPTGDDPAAVGSAPTGVDSGGQPAVATGITQQRLSVAQALRILQKDEAIADSSARYEIGVGQLPALTTFLRARRSAAPLSEPVEMAALAGLAFIALRRFGRRTRARLSPYPMPT